MTKAIDYGHKATSEQLDSLSDQLTDIRCAIRDALETAHGRPLLDYAQDCVKRCEDIVSEVRKVELHKAP